MGVRSHKFCCCLPVRIGVFVLSLLELLMGGLIAAALWAALILNKEHNTDVSLTTWQKTAAIILGIIMTVLAIVSLFGFIGSLIRRRSFVSLYSQVLNWHLGLSLFAMIYWAIAIFTEKKQDFINRCVNGSTDQSVINFCNDTTRSKILIAVGLVISWLIQLYCCIIVARYVVQLSEENEDRLRMSSLPSRDSYKYQSANRASQEFLTQPHLGYPYADAQHSYGHTTV